MNNMKKLASLLLALVMVLAMAAPAMASEVDGETTTTPTTYTITISNTASGHTYEAYQIFTGDLHLVEDEDGKVTQKVLSNVKWGANATQAGAVTDETLSSITIANAANYVDFSTEPVAESTYADGTYTISGLVAGYYLIKDQDNSLTGADDSYTSYILEVVEDSTVTPKSVKPTVDKQVKDEAADAEAGAVDGWGETADHAINESFQFKLIATLPASAHYVDYETYKVIFNDTMSDGVTFESIASVKVDGVTLAADQYNCTATENQEGGAWKLTINDVKSITNVNLTDGAVIEVIYNAHLNEAAKIGNDDDNQNEVYLQYSNNPNASGSGEGGEGGEGDEELGKTPEDTVYVFTYEMPNKKVAGDVEGEALAGAGFRLYTDEACTNEVALIFDTTLEAYRPVKGEEVGEEMVSAADTGLFNIKGLDAGTYYLKETTTPAGYNTCANITVVIDAVHAEENDSQTPAEAITTITMTVNGENATENTVVNESGATLPETGGMGTTMIYVIGCLMVAGAAIMLFAKKRAAK